MKLSFLQRQEKILEALPSNDDGIFITASQLAKICQASTKTIRNDISQLNDYFKQDAIIYTQKGKGYYLKILTDHFYEAKTNYFKQDHNIYDNTIQRSYFIIEKLLMNEYPIKIDDLAEELYIDRTTVSRDLKYVRDFLNKFHISIEHKPNFGNYIVGDEIHLRACLLDILNLQSIKKYIDIQEDMKNKIYQILCDDGISLNENSLEELTLYIYLAQYRIRNHHIIELSLDEKQKLFDEYEYQVAKDIWLEMGEAEIEDEICFLTVHIIGKRMNYVSDIESSIFNVFPAKIENIINEVYAYLLDIYGIDFSKDFYLKKALGMHILAMESRIRYDTYLKNPMLKDIKKSYFLAYQMGIDIWRFLYPQKDSLYSEDEIAYFTIHIQYALMRNQNNHKKKILLVNNLSSSSTELLNYELINKFDKYLEIKDSIYISQLENVDLKDYNLVLTTGPLSLPNIPIIQISSILNEKSIENIQQFFKTEYYCSLGNYLVSENIFVLEELNNIQEVFQFIYSILIENQWYVDYDDLLTREMIGNNVNDQWIAFPQMIGNQDEMIEIVISLEKPVIWMDSFVKKVIFIAYPKSFYPGHKEFYSLLQRFMLDYDAIHHFISLHDKNDMMTFLSSYK